MVRIRREDSHRHRRSIRNREEVAQEFLNIGANVVISDMAENAPEMDAKEGQLLYVRTDVTKVSDVEAMVAKTIETFGTIDVLVNNAGINIPRLLVDPKDPKGQYELDEAVWDKVCNVNLKGVFFCAQAVGRILVEKGEGVIINMSSESGLEGSEGQSVYAATKNASKLFNKIMGKRIRKTGSSRCRSSTWNHGSYRTSYNCL